jgi:transposase
MVGDPVAIARMHERHAHFLQLEINTLRRDNSARYEELKLLRKKVADLEAENTTLKRRIEELTGRSSGEIERAEPPAFVKPNVPEKARRKPGRAEGHAAALRPPPRKINVRQEVALPVDGRKAACCPQCHTQLSQLKHHRRIVEDIIPSSVVTTCYQTHSGYCPSCRKRVESRAAEQPPAADLPHAQLGINALATAAVLRIRYRLPFRQIAELFADLPGLKLSPGAVVKQIRRLSKWLAGQYEALHLTLRAAEVVHADETGWRINGKNGQLWTVTNEHHTLYHVDRSRSGKVIAKLLGEAFGGTLVSDFYAVYDQFDCPQQKCLTHLLRELRDTIKKRPSLASHAFFRQCKRLAQEALRLKKRRKGMTSKAYTRQVKSVESRLKNLGRKAWNDADADRLAARIRKYGPRLTTFLHHANVDGTNNAAERALRPAVVMRKITGGSRSESGAQAWAVLASIVRTAEQQGLGVFETIRMLLRAAWSGKKMPILFNTS